MTATADSYWGVMSLDGLTSAMDDLMAMLYSDTPKFEEAVKRCIPSEFLLIASQDDHTQAQEDYFAMDNFKLAKHVPKYVHKSNAGSVATCALLQLMYENPRLVVADNLKAGEEPINCLQLSKELKKRVKVATKLDAHPTISSSRPLGPARVEQAPPFYIVPKGYTGTRRALLIGVVGGEGPDLKGPPNDVTNIQQFLQKHCGFKPENITVLQDYNKHGTAATKSTKKNILAGFEKLVRLSKPNDVCFIQFSGHGGRVENNLYILPSDYSKAGQIMDEIILKDLIKKMPGGVYTTMLVDCCYSGTVGDLPYILQHNTSGRQEIDPCYDTDTRKEMFQKEATGGEDYQMYKRARSQQRVTGRLTNVVSVITSSAQAGYDAAAAAMHSGYDATAHVANDGYDAAARVARGGYDATAHVAHDGYDAAARVARGSYDTAGKTAAGAGKQAANLMETTSKGASDVGKSAADAMTKTANSFATSAAAVLHIDKQQTDDKSKEQAPTTSRFNMTALTNAANSAVHAASNAASNAGSTVLKTTRSVSPTNGFSSFNPMKRAQSSSDEKH